MSIFTTFTITIKGPEISLGRFHDYFEIGVREPSSDGDSVVDCSLWLEPLHDDHAEDQRSHFWVRDFIIETAAITLVGESRWTPPVEVVEKWSVDFTDLTFDLWGTTDHCLHEQWRIERGEKTIVELLEEDIQQGTETWYVKDGVELRELPEWFSMGE